jgi:hypothetical protein
MAVEFICNNFWQCIADHHVDVPHETKPLYSPQPFDPPSVKEGDTVFVKTDLLTLFLHKLLHHIPAPFYLITGHSDLSPRPEDVQFIDTTPSILRWWAVNAPSTNYKMTCLPLGLSEPDRAFGDQGAVRRCMARIPQVKRMRVFCPAVSPTHPLRAEAGQVEHPLLVKTSEKKPYEAYLTELSQYTWVLCPRGNGIDVHRVYEAILMQTIPIYVSDQVPALFKHLPVVVVRSAPDLPAALSHLEPPDAIDWVRAASFCKSACIHSAYGIPRQKNPHPY